MSVAADVRSGQRCYCFKPSLCKHIRLYCLCAVLAGMQGHLDQVEAPAQAATGPAPEPDLKSKKAPTGARARSIKTPLQREALEAAYLSKLSQSHHCYCLPRAVGSLYTHNIYNSMQSINFQLRKCAEL